MGHLYLIHDLSPSRPWLYAMLYGNSDRLAAQGLFFGPFNSFASDLFFSHRHFWQKFSEKKQPGTYIKGLWRELANQLSGENDILLFTHTTLTNAYDSFWQMLEEQGSPDKENISQLFVLAPPAIIIEQRYREIPGLGPVAAASMERSYGNQLMLIEAAQTRLGSNVQFTANLQAQPASVKSHELASQVMNFLGREVDPNVADSYLHPLRYQSEAGRQLSRMAAIRWNVAYPLDTERYADVLSELDQSWGEDFSSPPASRQRLTLDNYPQIGLLEQKLGVSSGAFVPGHDFMHANMVSESHKLSSEHCAEFAQALPEVVRKQLIKRYGADASILTEHQKLLYEALAPKYPHNETVCSEAEYVGSAEPPVELTVLTMAYNHEKYIAQCMDSVLMQKTDFPVRHIILDHHSSDATPDIIRTYAAKYPSIEPVLLSRRARTENIVGLFMRCKTKYAALCDGDDYFYSPDKLQKQVDYLQSRPHCSMCFHPVDVTFEDGSTPFRFPPTDMLPPNKKMEFYLAQITRHNFIQTNSVVYRWRFRDGLPDWFRADICPGDWYWHMLHAETGRIGFLPETMSVYRRHKGALYNDAFKNQLGHWRKRGLSELHAYDIYNNHFNGRYFKNFSTLASGIFAAFFKIAAEEADSTLLTQAEALYPRFALEFYKSLDQQLQ